MKLKDKKGLTLVEMLCTVAILVLVSMVMVLGVQLGVRSYAKSVSYSEAAGAVLHAYDHHQR